jgi:hypothetical protein
MEAGLMRKLALVLSTLVVWVAVLMLPATAIAAPARSVFGVRLTGGATGDSDGRGFALIRINTRTDTLCYGIIVMNIGQPVEPAPGLGNAHIHVAPTGGIAVDLHSVFVPLGGSTYVTADCIHADGATLDAIVASPEDYYVNVHTVAFPGGAVTGFLR